MKIGISSYSFKSHMEKTGENYFDIADRAAKMGYDGIEFIDLSLEVQPADSLETLADLIRAHCAALSLPIISYTVAADFMKPGRAAEVERVKRCVDIAARLSVPLLRHDATWQTQGDWHEVVDAIAPAIREVTAYAASRGIRTCTENHGYFIQDANRLECLIRTVNHPNYGWLVDIGNFACTDEDSVHAVSIAAPYAFHVHAKDFLYKPRGSQRPDDSWFPTKHGSWLRGTIAGHGVIPIGECIALLKAAGYAGYISYEFEGLEDNLPALEAALAYLKRSAMQALE